MKLLVDMNLSPRWVPYLERAGTSAIHWSAVGLHDAADEELMRWAADRGFCLLTSDLDFGAILAATRGRGPSVIQIRGDDLSPEAIGETITLAISRMHEEIAQGAIVSIDAIRTRIRLLPFDH